MTKQIVPVSPESLEVANTYLQTHSIEETAKQLGVSVHAVESQLATPELKRYVDNIYLDQGYRNRSKIGKCLDKLIEDKLEEMLDAEITSSKDIADLLSLAHKIRMDELKYQETMRKLETSTTNNTQINIDSGGENYSVLLQKLMKGKV